ncbi:MAG: FISUMP domain-containing protein [Bacteroidales bacterium]|nr:FISUMP domain-containing protein [Bacteroidales bacterium]
MKLRYSYLLLLIFLACFEFGFSEGTKELMPNESNPTRILLDPSPGRVPFALYSSRANPDYRLYIHIANPATEKIYFGLGQQRTGSGSTATETKITWRIHPPNSPDITECTGLTPIKNTLPVLPDVGYISTYLEAFSGPNALNPLGYNALTCTPTNGPGDYFMTFQATATRTFDYIDIAVVDITATPPAVIPGRVFSKCWQIRNPSYGAGSYYVFNGLMFIYSSDGIVTKLNPNGMEGRDFAVSCNESGCYPIAPPYNAQQARQSRPGPNPQTYPQYKIFLNNPDQIEYPDGIIGQLVDGSVTTETFCNTGTVNFNFQTTPVNAIGTVEITLQLSALTPPMVDRILVTNNVPGGVYSVTWDGLDGIGNQVPSGSTFPFTLRYTNGLTHMPLWDVEKNVNGFIVNLVRPVLVPPIDEPAFYWDDALVSGGQMLTPPGCTSPPATSCHAWGIPPYNGDWGDGKTINTWWFLVSNSTASVNLTYKIGPSVLNPINNPAQVCPGESYTFNVIGDPNSSSYFWDWGYGTLTTLVPGINITFPVGATPGALSVLVNGVNADCGNGPVTIIPVTVLPIPELSSSLSHATCSGNPFSVPLTSIPPGAAYSWASPAPNCTPNIALPCPPGGSGPSISGTVSVTDLNQGTVTYHVTPIANGCIGSTLDLVLTVDPKPNITSPVGPGENLCSGGTTSIVLQSGLAGATINWGVMMPGGCNNILTCPTSGSASPIVNQLTLNDINNPGSVIYTITPTVGGCVGDPVTYTVNVLQLPVVQLASFAPVCLNTPPFSLSGGTPVGATGIYTLGGSPLTIFDPLAAGVGSHLITYTYTDVNGCINADQKEIIVQDLITPSLLGSPTACLGVASTFTTDPGMVPSSYLWSVIPDGVITGADPDIKSIIWPSAGIKTITLTYTDPNGCTTIPASKLVTVNPLPAPTIATGNFNVCHSISYVYTTQPGQSNYFWDVSPGNTITFTDHTATVIWNVISGTEWIEVNYVDANGCTAVIPTRIPAVVNPTPFFNVTGPLSVCAGSTSIYQLQGTETGNWTITPGGTIALPANNVNSVSVNWAAGFSLAQASISVTYNNALGCAGMTLTNVDIQPLPITTFTTSTPSPVCQDFPTPSLYSVSAGGVAATYQWQVIPAVNALVADPTANPASITWKLPGSAAQTATLTLTAITSSTIPQCTASSAPVIITINPKPNTQLSSCFDLVTTTNAKPFLLKGGTPLGAGGKYYIDGSLVAGALVNPSGLSVANHTVSYTYTDVNGCQATANKMITVYPSNAAYSCVNNIFTDPRNSDPATNKYPTTTFTANGKTKCWMLKNLNWGFTLASGQPQTDNCNTERYCATNDNTCGLYGSLFQWDELMQYGSTPGWTKGVCPPGWHVPTAVEWKDLIDAIATITPGEGLAGFYLQYPTGFNALLNGLFYQNNAWAFSSGSPVATMFWTSTLSGAKPVAHGINSINPSVSVYENSKANAFPVRCVKD